MQKNAKRDKKWKKSAKKCKKEIKSEKKVQKMQKRDKSGSGIENCSSVCGAKTCKKEINPDGSLGFFLYFCLIWTLVWILFCFQFGFPFIFSICSFISSNEVVQAQTSVDWHCDRWAKTDGQDKCDKCFELLCWRQIQVNQTQIKRPLQ